MLRGHLSNISSEQILVSGTVFYKLQPKKGWEKYKFWQKPDYCATLSTEQWLWAIRHRVEPILVWVGPKPDARFHPPVSALFAKEQIVDLTQLRRMLAGERVVELVHSEEDPIPTDFDKAVLYDGDKNRYGKSYHHSH